MKLSLRSDYGARAIIDLAERYGDGPIQSAEIAQRQSIPEAYLEHLLMSLRKAGLVRSIRGPRGGHELAKQPDEINVAEVFEAIEGPFLSLECLDTPDNERNPTAIVTRSVWAAVAASADRVMRETTVRELLDRRRERDSRPMYHI